MKNILAISAVAALTATSAMAQTATTQASVIGDSGNPNYPLMVQGADGIQYMCKAETQVRGGVTVRPCHSGGGLGLHGNQMAMGGILAGGVLLALIMDDDDSSSTTTTTN